MIYYTNIPIHIQEDVSFLIIWHRQYAYSQRKRPLKTMKYNHFKDKMRDLCDKNNQNQPSIDDIMYLWDKYDTTYKLINNENMARSMRYFSKFSPKRRLLYREQLAESGIELTPSQVDYYINMITIILIEKYDIS